MNIYDPIFSRNMILGVVLLPMMAIAQAPLPPLEYLKSDPPTEKTSYASRIANRKGVHDADPHVYVYNAEFARRFQMPDEWISAELKGVDAVAFREVPHPYKTCGWGGNPKACRTDEVRCEMDMYFDQTRNPLPWDDRMNPVDTLYDIAKSSWFIGSLANQEKRPRTSLWGGVPLPRSPFTDPKTGKELMWQGGYWNSDKDRGGSHWGIASYDREPFAGMSLVTVGVECSEPADACWLSSSSVRYKEKAQTYKLVTFPQTWRVRVRQALRESRARAEAFFKREGEKAMKALSESPTPSQSIVPVQ